MPSKLRLELKMNPVDMAEILKEEGFPNADADTIFNLIRHDAKRFRIIAYSAIINNLKQSYWTASVILKSPAETAVQALKKCSPQEREQILFELKGVMN